MSFESYTKHLQEKIDRAKARAAAEKSAEGRSRGLPPGFSSDAQGRLKFDPAKSNAPPRPTKIGAGDPNPWHSGQCDGGAW